MCLNIWRSNTQTLFQSYEPLLGERSVRGQLGSVQSPFQRGGGDDPTVQVEQRDLAIALGTCSKGGTNRSLTPCLQAITWGCGWNALTSPVLKIWGSYEVLVTQPKSFCCQVQSGMTDTDNIREQGGRTKVFKMVFQYFSFSTFKYPFSDHNSGGGRNSLSENRPIHWGGLPHQLLYPSSVCLLAKWEIGKHFKMISWQQNCQK